MENIDNQFQFHVLSIIFHIPLQTIQLGGAPVVLQCNSLFYILFNPFGAEFFELANPMGFAHGY